MSDIVEIRKAFGRADVKEVWLSVPTLLDEVDRLRAINAELGADVKRKGDANLGLLYQNLGYAEMNEELRAINAELLAALEHVKRWADDATQSTRLDWNRVEAAIAKAKGATP